MKTSRMNKEWASLRKKRRLLVCAVVLLGPAGAAAEYLLGDARMTFLATGPIALIAVWAFFGIGAFRCPSCRSYFWSTGTKQDLLVGWPRLLFARDCGHCGARIGGGPGCKAQA